MKDLASSPRYRLRRILERAADAVPEPLVPFLEKSGLDRFYYLLVSLISDKHGEELAFQREWMGAFENNKGKVEEYWRRYRFLDEIGQECGLDDDTAVLDVGCGISTVLYFIEGDRYGIDPLAGDYREIHSYPEDIDIIPGRAEDLPFESGKFDVVFSSNALDHMQNPEKAIEEIRRVLSEDGFFVLTVEVFEEKLYRGGPHPHSFTYPEIMELVRDFETVFERSSPWMGLSRYVEEGEFEPENEELVLVLQK